MSDCFVLVEQSAEKRCTVTGGFERSVDQNRYLKLHHPGYTVIINRNIHNKDIGYIRRNSGEGIQLHINTLFKNVSHLNTVLLTIYSESVQTLYRILIPYADHAVLIKQSTEERCSMACRLKGTVNSHINLDI